MCVIGTSPLGQLGPDLLPHLPRDAAVQLADAVADVGQADGQDGHAEVLVLVVRVLPAQAEERRAMSILSCGR